jgi:tetratricopeptide (TPR) repeat protein
MIFTVATGALGISADWLGAQSILPCWMKSEEEISAPYGIAVANIAVQRDGNQNLSYDEKKTLKDINETLFKQIEAGYQDQQGIVGVSRLCDDDIQEDGNREEYLAEVRDTLHAELAVSLTVHPEEERFSMEIEMSIGSPDTWNEAQELAGYHVFKGRSIGISLALRDSANASLTERLAPYLSLLRSIASYANANYTSTLHHLTETLADPQTPNELKALALVLKGNAQGRLDGPGSLEAAESSFISAATLDPDYVRAVLGLAEIDYQKGLAMLTGSTCEGESTLEAMTFLDSAYARYLDALKKAADPRVRDADVRAKYGIGRIQTCKLLLGDKSQSIPAVRNLEEVTKRFESDTGKTWLRSAASGAYGELALIHCTQRQRKAAISFYGKASKWAVDDTRIATYEDTNNKIKDDPKLCT